MTSSEKGYNFQADWLKPYLSWWEKYLEPLKDIPNLNFLEIGSFEGRSTVWLLEHVLTHPTSRITCVDTFSGSDEHPNMGIDTSQIEQIFRNNIKLTGSEEKVEVKKGYSQVILKTLPEHTYDLAYIDGSHFAADVLSDSVLTFPLVKRGGIIVFDDYYWDLDPIPLHQPHMAIKAFLEIFQDKLELIMKAEQVFVKKIHD